MRDFFDRYPAAFRPTSAVEPLGNAGGLSGARLWRFSTARGPIVARRWPPEGADRARLEQVHSWLNATAGLGFVPVPIPTLDGRTIVERDGEFWELAPWMPGQADPGRPPRVGRLRAGFAGLAAFLARLQSDRTTGPSPGLIARMRELERLLSGEFDSIADRIERTPGDPLLPLARRWIVEAKARAAGVLDRLRKATAVLLPLQPCLRDARPDHFLFDGDRLSGLVDFGAMGQDSVAGDLARLMAEGIGPDRAARAEALGAFSAIFPLGGAELRAIEAIERANALLGPGRWVRWHFVEGRTFGDGGAVARGLQRGLERLGEAF